MSDTVRVPFRGLITASAMLAMLMQTLDSTIANVALPYMQGSMSASADEITWVLTSYVIAAAIMTAPVGWMAVRFGRKQLFIICLAGFTVASMMCGAAQSAAADSCCSACCRACAAPRWCRCRRRRCWTSIRSPAAPRRWRSSPSGVTMGPMIGPTLGGYLTDWYNWRYVFYVNLPFGILAIVGLALFMPNTHRPAGPEIQLVRLRACWRWAPARCR